VLGVGHGLALGDLAHQALAVLGEANNGWGCPPTLLVDDDRRLAAFHDRDDRIRGPEVDTDDFAHVCIGSE
jgi:hypothetical protein